MAEHGIGGELGFPGRRAVEGERGGAVREATQMRGVGSALPFFGAPNPRDAAKGMVGVDPAGIQILRLLNRSLKQRKKGFAAQPQ